MIIISVYTCVWTCEFVEMPAWKEQQVMIAAFENKRMILFLIFLFCSVFDHCGVTKKYWHYIIVLYYWPYDKKGNLEICKCNNLIDSDVKNIYILLFMFIERFVITIRIIIYFNYHFQQYVKTYVYAFNILLI